jgi:hypothetical protein
MWKLKNSEGTEQLCHTLDEVVTIILNAPILLEYTLKFIPLYEKPKPPALREREEELEKGFGTSFPIPLSSQD